MGADGSTESRKRTRAAPVAREPAIPWSFKRRKLDANGNPLASSPTTPKTTPGAASSSTVKKTARKIGSSPASAYDVPDSPEDNPPQRIRNVRSVDRPTGKVPIPPRRSTEDDIYEIPGSDDELHSSPKEVDSLKTSPTKRKSIGAVNGGASEADTGNMIKQRTSRKQEKKTTVGQNKEVATIEESSQRDGTPKRSKNVAFDSSNARDAEEVFFEDIPIKSATKSGRGGKPPQKLASTKTTATKPARPRKALAKMTEEEPTAEEADSQEEEQVAAEKSDENKDEDVCLVCSKPDSKAGNLIMFCDGCDKAYHQKCYKVPKVPRGDWFCNECLDQKKSRAAAADEAVKIPNFQQHLSKLKRVLLDRCTGRRRIKLVDQDEAMEKAHQLVEQTVLSGEGNSMLIIGARGCGKTTLVESIIDNMSLQHKKDFHVVRLSGFIHTDDKLALKEIWRQLGKEMDAEDEVNARSNYADTMTSLLALLSHPSEMAQAEEGVTSQSVVFAIDEFDMFAAHPRQTLLYNLFDIAQARKAPIAVLGCTTRMDVVEMLEKRVKSRFSHRYVYLSPPRSLPAYWKVCRQGLVVDDEDMEAEGIDVSVAGHEAFHANWKAMIESLYKEKSFQDLLQYHYVTSKSASDFLAECIMPLSCLSTECLELVIPPRTGPIVSLRPPNSKLHMLPSLSELDLGLLIAAARLDIVAHTDTVNFAMAYDEYGSLMGRQRVQSASSGMLALGGGVRVWGRGVAGLAWERLVALGLLVPAGLGTGRASGYGGLEGKMWKVDMALEEIAVGVKLNNVLARWCKEI
ncbi:hypothetical protein LZ31DRAFT_579688 [Colletotrichum somersetense]|nr:hypothetical protein LZ31DRAFT_579688 [Colletotrichum somersetense]